MLSIACTLGREDRGTQRGRWLALGSRALVDVETTTGGLQLVFTDAMGVKEELSELTELERRCCAFARWTVGGRPGLLVLDVTGSSGEAVLVVQGMFGPLRELLPRTKR